MRKLSHYYYPRDSCNIAQKHLLPTTIHSAFYLHFTVLLALLQCFSSLPIFVQGKNFQCQAKPAHRIWTCPPATLADGDNLGTGSVPPPPSQLLVPTWDSLWMAFLLISAPKHIKGKLGPAVNDVFAYSRPAPLPLVSWDSTWKTVWQQYVCFLPANPVGNKNLHFLKRVKNEHFLKRVSWGPPWL